MHTIFKVTEQSNNFRGKIFTVQEVGYPKETDTLRSDMRGSAVYNVQSIYCAYLTVLDLQVVLKSIPTNLSVL